MKTNLYFLYMYTSLFLSLYLYVIKQMLITLIYLSSLGVQNSMSLFMLKSMDLLLLLILELQKEIIIIFFILGRITGVLVNDVQGVPNKSLWLSLQPKLSHKLKFFVIFFLRDNYKLIHTTASWGHFDSTLYLLSLSLLK